MYLTKCIENIKSLKNILNNNRKRGIDFIVIGAQKSGTTAIDKYLRMNPKVSMANVKEVHFFDQDKYFFNKIPNYLAYESHFSPFDEGIIYGEVTPSYMYKKNAIKRIWKYNKNIKLIAVLRNPIERAFSHWNMEVNRGYESKSFSSALTLEESRLKVSNSDNWKKYSYFERGLYSVQLKELFKYFKKEQVLIIKYEDFLSSQQQTMDRVFKFLGVDSIAFVIKKKYNKIPYAKSINEHDKKQLVIRFMKDIKAVEDILKWDCSDWKKGLT